MDILQHEFQDSNGGTTQYQYDSLDRQIKMIFHDGSTRLYGYDLASDLTGYTDENQSVSTSTFDPLSRKISTSLTLATNVQGTTAQAFQYDGLRRPTFARDSVSTVNADVSTNYDSLSRILEETQTYGGSSRYVTHDAWQSLPSTDLTYPNGRQVTSGYDALYRMNAINETSGGASIAAWQFFGQRTATVTLGNAMVTSYMNNAQDRSAIQYGQTTPGWGSITTDQLGYDGAGRLIGKRHFSGAAGAGVIIGNTSAYDKSSNKLFERALHAESRSSLYPSYDSMNRLLEYQRGTLASGGGSITTAISLPNTNQEQDYNLDALGNWSTTTITPEGGSSATQTRIHNKLNEVTKYGTTNVLYDHGNNTTPHANRGNGNIADDGIRTYSYDAFNRLTTVARTSDGAIIGQYTYDALGRRLRKIVSNGGLSGDIANVTTRYLYDQNQWVEELNVIAGTTLRQFIWGQYIDELIQMKTYADTGSQPLPAGVYYLLSDLLYRSEALTDYLGEIQEAYDCDAYGNTLVYSGPGTDTEWFTDDDIQTLQPACEYIFTGREYDPESQIYNYRARYLQPPLGRFISRDPIGYGEINLYLYVRNNPISRIDPHGLMEIELGGGEYEGFGGSVDLDIKTSTACCKHNTKPVYDVKLTAKVGVGLGGHIHIIGHLLDLEFTGPQLQGSTSITCEGTCGKPRSLPKCCRVCVDLGVQLGYSTSATIFGIGIEQSADVSGSVRVCYMFGSQCPGTGLAWGFCGQVSYGATIHLGLFSFEYDFVDTTSGCHAFMGTNAMLNYGS